MEDSSKRSTAGKAIVYGTAFTIALAGSMAGKYSPGAGCNIRDAVKICSERPHVPVGHVQPEPGPNNASSSANSFGWIDTKKMATAT